MLTRPSLRYPARVLVGRQLAISDFKFMPSSIAEFPSGEFQTSLQAIKATFERIRANEYAGRTILLSGQSYEADGEQYRKIDVLYKNGTFKFKNPVPDIELVARFARIPPERVTVLENGRAVTMQMGSLLSWLAFWIACTEPRSQFAYSRVEKVTTSARM
jgi:hypothetical protein